MEKTLPKTLPAFFWHFVKPYKWYVLGMFGTGLFWGIFTSLSPYLLKLIIDGITDLQGDKLQVFEAVKPFVISYMIIWVLVATNFRILDWINLRLQPNIRRDVVKAMFSYLNRHSYSYFQNNFYLLQNLHLAHIQYIHILSLIRQLVVKNY